MFVFTKILLLVTVVDRNLLLVTVVAQFNDETTNSEKAIYFLSLMSCSINKVKSHMLFTCYSLAPPYCSLPLSLRLWKDNYPPLHVHGEGGSFLFLFQFLLFLNITIWHTACVATPSEPKLYVVHLIAWNLRI